MLLFCGQHASQPDAAPFWFPPGGGVEDGEELRQAGIREVREEVGIELHDLGEVVARRRATFDFEGDRYEQDEHIFCVAVPRVQVDRSGWTEVERRTITEVR